MLTDLVLKLWQQLLILKQFHDDSITKSKARTRLGIPSKGFQQPVIPATASYGAQLTPPVMSLEHNACTGAILHCTQHSMVLCDILCMIADTP